MRRLGFRIARWHFLLLVLLSSFQGHISFVAGQTIPREPYLLEAYEIWSGLHRCASSSECAVTCFTASGTEPREDLILCQNIEITQSVDACIKLKCHDGDRDSVTMILQESCGINRTTTSSYLLTSTHAHQQVRRRHSSSTAILSTVTETGKATTSSKHSSSSIASKNLSISPLQSTAHLSPSLVDSRAPTMSISASNTEVTATPGAATIQPSRQTKRHLVPLIAGAICGACVIISGAVTGLCALRRFRRRRENEEAIVLHPTPYVVHAFNDGGRPEGGGLYIRLLDLLRGNGGGDQLPYAPRHVAKSRVVSTQNSVVEGGRKVIMVSMHHVNEIRKEMARLRQLLMGVQPSSISPNISPDQSAQLSEMREVHQLRQLDSLQPANRRDDFDRASRTTSPPPPAYEY